MKQDSESSSQPRVRIWNYADLAAAVSSPGLGKMTIPNHIYQGDKLSKIVPNRYKVGSRLAITLLSPGSGYETILTIPLLSLWENKNKSQIFNCRQSQHLSVYFLTEWLKSIFLVKVLCYKPSRLFLAESDRRGIKALLHKKADGLTWQVLFAPIASAISQRIQLISVFEGKFGSSNFRALSTPTTGNLLGSSKPSCTKTVA